MKTSVLILVLTALLASGAAASRSTSTQRPQLTLYGHVKSVARVNGQYQVRFDPAWWLTGLAAERACGCKPVANDYFVVDEGHRLLTFPVRSDARVTILVRSSGPVGTASITVAEFAQIVQGKNPRHRKLLEPKAGFWARVANAYPSPIMSLEQQYQP
jgi:hypothetical protein